MSALRTLLWRIVLLVGLIAAPAAASAQRAAAATDGAAAGTTVSLDGSWRFALAPTRADADRMAGFHAAGFDSSAFRPIPVPSNWVMHGYDQPRYKLFKEDAAEGFYLHSFRLPAGWNDRRLLLHFGGVWSSAEVWLNGKYLGRQDTGFTRISFDVSGIARAKGENQLAVRVRQLQPSYRFDTNDDWTIGGIYRPVTIEAMPRRRWLDRVQVETDFDSAFRNADLRVRVMVGDTTKQAPPGNFMFPAGEPYVIRLMLRDAAGAVVKAQDVAVEGHAGTGRETLATLHLERPLHWTAETPNLYRLDVALVEQDRVAHVRNVRVGFREISTSGGVLRINGQAIKLRGVNRHDEHPATGRATTAAQWREDLLLMKAANINYVRLAHYPSDEGFVALADELGMYLSDEIPYGYGGGDMHDPATAGAALLRNLRTVERDINNPSVIIWSIGNEDPLTSLHLASVKMVKGLDPTRPVLLPWRAETWLPPEIDILSAHYFTAPAYDALAARADRPIVSTEWTHAFANEGFGGLDDRWKALTRHPAGAGGAIWLWADQALAIPERKPDGSVATTLLLNDDGYDGIVDAYRKPTRDYWEAKAVYAPVFPEIGSADVTVGQTLLRVPLRNDYDFTDLKTVKIGWTLFEDATALADGNASVGAAPHTLGWLEVPLAAVKNFKPDALYTLRLRFARPDGSEIGERSIELRSKVPAPVDPVTPIRPTVGDAGGLVTVASGTASYAFDPATGLLASAGRDGKPRLLGARPTIWRPMNHSEMIIVKGDKGVQDLPDLNLYSAAVRSWKVEQAADTVAIRASVRYTVNADNRFDVDYNYVVRPTGELAVRYRIVPTVQAKWLPHVGLDLQLAAGMDRLRWHGLGPVDAWPNKRTAAVLGVWDARLGDGAAGTKAVRRVTVSDGAGQRLTLSGEGHVDFGPAQPDRIRMLSSIVGRPNKVWRPEFAEQRLDAGAGKTFAGEFVIALP